MGRSYQKEALHMEIVQEYILGVYALPKLARNLTKRTRGLELPFNCGVDRSPPTREAPVVPNTPQRTQSRMGASWSSGSPKQGLLPIL